MGRNENCPYGFSYLHPMPHPTTDRLLGSFIGLALGDALGTTLEFVPRPAEESQTCITATARFLSVDPLTAAFPHRTPYSFADNTPIY